MVICAKCGAKPTQNSLFQCPTCRDATIRATVRDVVERYEHASLDAKADREALIKALVEALT